MSSRSTCEPCGGTRRVKPWLGPKRRGLSWPCPRCSSTSEIGDTMPYVITTSKPCPEGHPEPLMAGDGGGWDGTNYHTPPCETCGDRCELVTRRAVATIEQTRADVANLAVEHGRDVNGVLSVVARSIGEQGGKVGPLPDGATIEVEPTDYHALWRCTPIGKRGGAFMEMDGDEIVAAYNAAGGPDLSAVGTFSAGEAA